MEQLSSRLAGLSDNRRRLLERLVHAGANNGKSVVADPPTAQVRRLENLSPPKLACSSFYDDISRQLDSSDIGQFSQFLNLGYAIADKPSFSKVSLPERYLNKNSTQLVLEVIGDCDLSGRKVLDVGCGRGGTVSVIRQYFDARKICGIDLAPAAIKFCRESQRYPDITFEVGDAEQLPFPDKSFDAITNIESSSIYPNIFSFYQEVFRVLKPGGHFLYTDALPSLHFAECAAYLEHLGFLRELDRDITANVLASCDEISGHRIETYGAQSDQAMKDFLGAPGSAFYDEMKRGRWSYRIQRWQKPVSEDDA